MLLIYEDVILGGVFVQAEDGIRDLVRSRGLGDVYKRQDLARAAAQAERAGDQGRGRPDAALPGAAHRQLRRLSLIHI